MIPAQRFLAEMPRFQNAVLGFRTKHDVIITVHDVWGGRDLLRKGIAAEVSQWENPLRKLCEEQRQNPIKAWESKEQARTLMENIRRPCESFRSEAVRLMKSIVPPTTPSIKIVDPFVREMNAVMDIFNENIRMLYPEGAISTQTAVAGASRASTPPVSCMGASGSRVSFGDAAGTSGMAMAPTRAEGFVDEIQQFINSVERFYLECERFQQKRLTRDTGPEKLLRVNFRNKMDPDKRELQRKARGELLLGNTDDIRKHREAEHELMVKVRGQVGNFISHAEKFVNPNWRRNDDIPRSSTDEFVGKMLNEARKMTFYIVQIKRRITVAKKAVLAKGRA